MKIRSPYENVKFTSVFNKFKTINFFKKKNLTLFDVGANKGQSIIEYKKFLNYKKLNIHCFEPNTDILKKIINLKEKLYKKKNIQITANNLALSDVNKVRLFYKNSKRSALSSFCDVNKKSKDYLIMKKKKYYKFVEKAFVKTATINKYINDKKIKFVDILKIDTQGHELEVIKGANKSFNKIGIIVVSILFYDFYKKKRISFFDVEKIIKKNFIFYDLAHLYKNPKNNSIDHVEAIYVNKSLL